MARFQQSSGIESAPLQDEVILFHSPSNKFCVLNRTSSFIWSRLTQPATAEQIALDVSTSFEGISQDGALQDVHSTLEKLTSLGMVVEC